MHYNLTVLDNGLRVISETMTGVRSVAVGCWVDTGSRDELPNEAGASHFLEHLLYKGTEQFSARHISESFDAMGAEANAFTAKDHTCFWARMLDRDVRTGFELLAGMLQAPAFRPTEIDSERQVVVEEINMNDDDPSEVAFEEFSQAVFSSHPLEPPILGTRASIRAMGRDDLQGYWKRRYGVGSTVIAMTGAIQHDQVVSLVEEFFGGWGGEAVDHETAPHVMKSRVRLQRRETEQAHLVIGGRGLTRQDPRRFADNILNHVLGGGLSSRLFQTIREDRGLAYAIYSFKFGFVDAGAWGVYVGTTPQQTGTCLRLIGDELNKVVEDEITDKELVRAKGSLRGSLALSMEDPSSRMVRLGKDELSGGPHLTIDERMAAIEAVTVEEVHAVATEQLAAPRVIGAVGPFDVGDLEPYLQ
jgi:predicted Zn-dependent peptidase